MIQVHRKVPAVGSIFSGLGVYTGAAALTGSTYVLSRLIMTQTTDSGQKGILEENDCMHTPFWDDPAKVKRLRDKDMIPKDQAILHMRLSGR